MPEPEAAPLHRGSSIASDQSTLGGPSTDVITCALLFDLSRLHTSKSKQNEAIQHDDLTYPRPSGLVSPLRHRREQSRGPAKP